MIRVDGVQFCDPVEELEHLFCRAITLPIGTTFIIMRIILDFEYIVTHSLGLMA